MATKAIELELNQASSLVITHSVDLDDDKNTYEVEMRIRTPHDNSDFSELLTLQRKIRGVVNRGYSISFLIKYKI